MNNNKINPFVSQRESAIDSQIRDLTSRPAYLSPKVSGLREHNRLIDEVQKLYRQKSGNRMLED